MLSKVEVNLQAQPEHNRVRIESLCRLTGKTGVEMEALTAASVAALTIYDMCKAVQKIWSLARCACWRKAAASPAILRWTNAMIKVLFFAQVRELVGTDALTLDASDLATVRPCASSLPRAATAGRWP